MIVIVSLAANDYRIIRIDETRRMKYLMNEKCRLKFLILNIEDESFTCVRRQWWRDRVKFTQLRHEKKWWVGGC